MWIVVALIAGGLFVLLVANLSTSQKKIEQQIEHLYPIDDPQFVRSMGTLLGPAILNGNRVTALCNGDEIFPAMLDAIRGAERTITFETFIYWSGSIGKAFAQALTERARAGVVDRLNNRTHRKLLVVDGRVGFTGGVGIADTWLGNAEDPDHWRDSHFKLEGPAVAQMQAAFMDNWIETEACVLHGEPYFPELAPAGNHSAQLFKSSATDASESVRLMYLLSITSAVKSVRIANAYFVPDGLAVDTLVAAQRRGVKVEIIVPGQHIDKAIVRKASRSLWEPLLEAGVAIYEYQPTMYHTKVMVVDELWTSVGSTNFDNRSFRLNDEANLNILDAEFARSQARLFEADKARSKQLTLAWWRSRPWHQRTLESLAGLLRLQL